jgi:ATPase family AAA domain-containing protein 2
MDYNMLDAPAASPDPAPSPNPHRNPKQNRRPAVQIARPPQSDLRDPSPVEKEMRLPPTRPKSRPKARGPGWSATGAELVRYMGLPQDDTDSDVPTRTPRKQFGAVAGAGDGGLFAPASNIFASDLAAAAGTPSNLGKIGDAGP